MEPYSILMSNITGGAAGAYLLLLAQKWSKLPWVTEHTTWVNVAIRMLLSFFTTLGITTAWSTTATGGHVLAFTIPPIMVLLHGLWSWFGQYAMQHGWLELFSVNTAPPHKA